MANIQFSFERYEKKYRITPEQQAFILEGMSRRFRPDDYGNYSLCSIYYDTDDWRLVRSSIEKPVYKEKLRLRSYGVPGENGTVFAELKKKFDGVVYKRRITATAGDAMAFLAGNGGDYGQIGREISWFQSFYSAKPRVFIGYDRSAFTGIENEELRVTFDTNIRWRVTDLDLRLGDHGAPLTSPDDTLMEIKLPGSCPLWLSHLLSEAEVFPASFSKYGTCYKNFILPDELRKGALACA